MRISLSPGPEFVDVATLTGVRVDLRYASVNNFTGDIVYKDLQTAYLHTDAVHMLTVAARLLQEQSPTSSLLVLDALRPVSAQRYLWSYVKNTPEQIYVADPDKGSIHNFGLAVDLTICNQNGQELDMGTPFDSFQELAQPRFEEKFLTLGALTKQHIENRHLLRDSMTKAGFLPIPHEWWHFNAVTLQEAKRKYKKVE